jgi:micrococcal nuclease
MEGLRQTVTPRRLSTTLVTALLTATFVLTGAGADAAAEARVTRWVDGDTVETTRGVVRLIGIDTPERDSCGFRAALRHAQAIAPVGSRIHLGNPASVVNRDDYGRKLRYVSTYAGRDLGMAQIRDGARARYDGRDGYQWHRKQAAYRRADAEHAGYSCATGAAVPVGADCPSSAPIKGNANSMIYHQPGQEYYDITVPEECFATAAAAERAGYRAAKA